MIPPDLAPRPERPEPVRPALPTDGGVDPKSQTTFGPVTSAPTATGISFEGIGVGIPGFVPSATHRIQTAASEQLQYVQWNNTSFAVWSKTGTLLYGPAAGNTLFQTLGGVCASHNDGDPVVAYDLMSGRWILSQCRRERPGWERITPMRCHFPNPGPPPAHTTFTIFLPMQRTLSTIRRWLSGRTRII